jgi:YidC/Oxa1 family membrane protein insertase
MPMNKRDWIILAALVALFMAWPSIDRHLIYPAFHDGRKPSAEEPAPAEPTAREDVSAEEPALIEPAPGGRAPALAEPTAAQPPATEVEPTPEPLPAGPEELAVLRSGDLAEYVFTTHGAALKKAVLLQYRQTVDKDSPPIELDFSSAPAIAYEGMPAEGESAPFRLISQSDDRLVFERPSAGGLALRREIELLEGYRIRVLDTFRNTSRVPLELRGLSLRAGPIHRQKGVSSMRGMSYLGVDTLSPGGDGVQHFSKKISGYIEEAREQSGAGPGESVTAERNPLADRAIQGVDWAAVKNKFFVQILTPDTTAAGIRLRAGDEASPEGRPEPVWVSALLDLTDLVLDPGEEQVRETVVYTGPKKYSELAAAAHHKARIMEFGMLSPIAVVLLRVLNALYALIPNFGVAIILLTGLIKVVFLPVTHKGMSSMRKMQEVQPKIAALKEKYKDNPQRQQKEIMELYRENKINPLGGCLPLIIQIPVFISLFTVLRSAIELRFARFLWVKDLSEPERLLEFGFTFPLIGWDALNILPLLMAGTMVLQQRLSPAAGDPQQQKIMAVFMPIMMLVMLYNFPAGLILYWTSNQCMSIVGQWITRRKKAAAQAA